MRFHDALEPLMEPAGGIYPDPENYNNGDIDEIIGSIIRNGCYRPIITNKDGMILAGHHLYAALLELGAMKVPVLRVDVDRVTAKRISFADNLIPMLARRDEALMLEGLRWLQENDTSLAGTGINDDGVEKLAARLLREVDEPLLDEPQEDLDHTIICPRCGHSWVRGKDKHGIQAGADL